MWATILADLKAILAKIEGELANAWSFLTAFIQEAYTEEEAALFAAVEAQATKLLQDEATTQGLTVKQRVEMAVAEITADLGADAALAATTLYNSYVWTVAHKLNLTDGNQGSGGATGDFSGNTPAA